MEIQSTTASLPIVSKDSNQKLDFNGLTINQASKQLQNAAIASATMVAIGSSDDSMSLLYKAAISAINDVLAPSMGQNAVQNTYTQNIDTSSDATSSRIVDFSTAFFSSYQSKNPDMSLEDQLSGFMSIIGDAIDKGFGDAKNVLSGLGALDGVSSVIDDTYKMVQDKLAQFKESIIQTTDSNTDTTVES